MALTPPSVSKGVTRKAAATALREFGLDPVDLQSEAPARPSQVASRRSILPILLTSDALALGTALFVGSLLAGLGEGRTSLREAALTVPYLLLFLPVLSTYGLYRRARRRLVASMFPDLSQLVHSVIVGCLILLLLAGPASRLLGLATVKPTSAAVLGAFAVIMVPVARAVTRWLTRPSGQAISRVLVVGSGQVAAVVLQRLARMDDMHVVGCVDDEFAALGGTTPKAGLLGNLDELPDIVAANNVDHVIVAFSPATGAKLAGLLRSLANDVQISVVPRLFDLLTVRSHVDDLHGLPVVDVAPAALGPADRFAKRGSDLLLSFAGLVVLSPAILAVAAGIKLTSPGPVLFRQQRTGRGGRCFQICKFRTMDVGAETVVRSLRGANEVDGPLFKMRDDPRVTRLGRFLRKTSLDEIPQLLNVFKGDMSLVGPRPFVTTESAEIEGWAARRFDVRPGMTGLWQISGRNDLPFEELCRLDYSYVASWSLWWDLRILWHTPASVLRRWGAY